jgi:hypothetical protein
MGRSAEFTLDEIRLRVTVPCVPTATDVLSELVEADRPVERTQNYCSRCKLSPSLSDSVDCYCSAVVPEATTFA